MENDFQFENRKLESEVVSKERKLSELNESMIQLARNTNDEIKLLRDEFEIFNKMKKKNKRYQSFQKNEDFDNNSLMMMRILSMQKGVSLQYTRYLSLVIQFASQKKN